MHGFGTYTLGAAEEAHGGEEEVRPGDHVFG